MTLKTDMDRPRSFAPIIIRTFLSRVFFFFFFYYANKETRIFPERTKEFLKNDRREMMRENSFVFKKSEELSCALGEIYSPYVSFERKSDEEASFVT